MFRDSDPLCSLLYEVEKSTKLKSPYSVEQELRLHGKMSSCYTLGLHLRTLWTFFVAEAQKKVL
jgi:hypothetical protein